MFWYQKKGIILTHPLYPCYMNDPSFSPYTNVIPCPRYNLPYVYILYCAHQASQPALTSHLEQQHAGGQERGSLVSAMGAEGAVERAVAAGGIGFSALPQPAPLAFDIREIEKFRYRVEDTIKKVWRGSKAFSASRVQGSFSFLMFDT